MLPFLAPPPARRLGRRRPARRLACLGLALALAAVFAAGASSAGPGPARAALPDGLLQAPTPDGPWEPDGSWRSVHGPSLEPLWQGGEGRSDRPCGAMADRAGNRGTTPPLCAVHGQPDGAGGWIGWAVGEQGMLARYTAGHWERVDDLDPRRTSPLTYHLHDVFVIGARDVWAVGWVEGDRGCPSTLGCGAVLHYDGVDWTMQPRSPMGIFACMERLNAIDMQQDAEGGWYGWAVGDKSDDCQAGGALYLGYNYDASKPDTWRWFRVPQASRNMHDVKIVERGDVWAVGEFGIESHWHEPVANPSWSVYGKSGADDRFSVDLADPTYGWDAGVRGRLNRYVGTCHDDDPGTQCWFDNMASPIQDQSGNKVITAIFDLDLIDRRRGWLVGAEDSRRSTIAYLYEDKRWKTAPIEGDPGKSLYGLHVVDPGLAFAVGDEGTILEYRAVEAPSTATASPSPSVTATPPPSATPERSPEPSATPGSSPEPSATLEPTPSASPEASATPAETPAETPSVVPPSATATDRPPPSATLRPTDGVPIYAPFVLKRR
ncbi:MAG: hypothetical protein H6648_08470 [Caldilineae bacterium]|nr:hypothetical protein [Chloroflexota bacterium]MCB9177181.1 hypothetical protein [Caldilineae bacterium]